MKRSLFVILAATVLLCGCASLKLPSPGEMEEAAAQRSPVLHRAAPAFSLPNSSGDTVRLSELRGQWVVLYFYPKDDTPGCRCQATEFTQLLKRFRTMNAHVLGISEDTPDAHRKFMDKYNLKLELLSDPTHETMKAYGAWVQAWIGQYPYPRVIRTTYLIDPDGIVRHHWPEVIPRGHARRVRVRLAQLQEQAG